MKTFQSHKITVRKKVAVTLLLCCLILLCFPPLLFSGTIPASVSAKLDTNQIRIGEQFRLDLTAVTQAGITVRFPMIPDSMKGLEVVRRSAIDTSKSADGKNFTYHQLLQLTSFDSGYYVIEPLVFTFQDKPDRPADSLSTEAQLISVRTIAVDTTREIKDIKATLDVPFSWKEILVYIILGLLVISVILAIIYFIRKRKKPEQIIPQKPKRPAHEIALEALKQTESEKLWQQGQFKKYHIAVADILRTYIEHRFDIQSMELTTDETLQRFHGNTLSEEAREKLRSILQLSDLVKFAKYIPDVFENEQSISYAYAFIALTKKADVSDFTALEVPA